MAILLKLLLLFFGAAMALVFAVFGTFFLVWVWCQLDDVESRS
jgi:hypothetical protein